MKEQDVIDLIMSGELGPEDVDNIEIFLNEEENKHFQFRPLIRRIFDIDNSLFMNKSEANRGIMGFFNRIGNKRKNRIFRNRIKNINNQNLKIIVAEGDSWFEYPIFIKVDIGRKRNNVYHVDCRGVGNPKSWFDELHMKSRYFKKVALTYIECIDSTDSNKKVFRVVRK